MKFVMFLVVLGVLFIGAYYLFFAPTPAFDYIAPTPLQQATELSNFDLDPDTVLKSSQFRSLTPINGLPTGGAFGRSNPFLNF